MTITCAQEEKAGGDKTTAATATPKPGDKVVVQQLRDRDCVEEPDWAETRTEMFKVSKMQGNLEEGLKEVNHSIYQVAENTRLAAEKANTNADQMVLLLSKVLVQLFGGLSPAASMDAGRELRRPSETGLKEVKAEEVPTGQEDWGLEGFKFRGSQGKATVSYTFHRSRKSRRKRAGKNGGIRQHHLECDVRVIGYAVRG
ncbi:unnamed protein product [Linum trigynum]|uniref:Uncharacterized protein n=1 Tax=Linum trigynum TaxID=586398 RepID=A0AAV2E7V2_9ROSI